MQTFSRFALPVAVVALCACGARTGLPLPDASVDARVPGMDARMPESGVDATLDACAPSTALLAAGADIALAIDRSGSMMTPLVGSSMSRWDGLEAAMAATLPSIDATVAVGATFYPTMDTEEVRCTTSATMDVPIALGSARAVLDAFATRGPGGGTPTAAALLVALGALRARSRVGLAQSIVLATDGGPNCNQMDAGQPWYGVAPETCLMDGLDPHMCLDDVRTIEVLDEAFAAGIPTYVIGMSVTLPLLVDTMNRMAVAGGRPRPGPSSFYAVERPDELAGAFAEIAALAAACSFVPATPVDLSRGTVTVDGVPLTRDGADGWSVEPSGTIELMGSGCTRAQRPGAVVVFEPPCS